MYKALIAPLGVAINTLSASTPVRLVPMRSAARQAQTRMAELALLVGGRVRALRHARGLRQADLAERVGLSEEWIRRIERGAGSPSLESLEQLAWALDVHVSSLLEADPSEQDRLRPLIRTAGELGDDSLRWLEAAARLARSLEQSTGRSPTVLE